MYKHKLKDKNALILLLFPIENRASKNKKNQTIFLLDHRGPSFDCQDINPCYLLQKVPRRVSPVDQVDWDDAKKERCNKYLKLHKLNYTSSDESKLSENESKCDTKRFVTKRLPWEGPRSREIKYLLDLVYRSFNSHVRSFQMQGVVSERFSLRGLSLQMTLNGSLRVV